MSLIENPNWFFHCWHQFLDSVDASDANQPRVILYFLLDTLTNCFLVIHFSALGEKGGCENAWYIRNNVRGCNSAKIMRREEKNSNWMNPLTLGFGWHLQTLTNPCYILEKSMYQFWQIHVTTKKSNFDKSVYKLAFYASNSRNPFNNHREIHVLILTNPCNKIQAIIRLGSDKKSWWTFIQSKRI